MRFPHVLMVTFLTVVTAQKGKECSDDNDCEEHQSCSFGYCMCSHGFVKIKNLCYKDGMKHGEKCEDDIQCSRDHRLGCKELGNGYKVCQCNKYFEYSEELEECVNAKNLTEILLLMQEQWKTYEKLDTEAKRVFVGLVSAGLLSIVLGIVFAGGCIIYGCCIPRWKMYQFPEEDFQTMPLCPASRETTVLPTSSGEKTTPPASRPTSLNGPPETGNSQSQTDAIV